LIRQDFRVGESIASLLQSPCGLRTGECLTPAFTLALHHPYRIFRRTLIKFESTRHCDLLRLGTRRLKEKISGGEVDANATGRRGTAPVVAGRLGVPGIGGAMAAKIFGNSSNINSMFNAVGGADGPYGRGAWCGGNASTGIGAGGPAAANGYKLARTYSLLTVY
jgi:hypothetical protein